MQNNNFSSQISFWISQGWAGLLAEPFASHGQALSPVAAAAGNLLASERVQTDCSIYDFNENVRPAYTRAPCWGPGLSKDAQKEASEFEGAPLDASGIVLGRSSGAMIAAEQILRSHGLRELLGGARRLKLTRLGAHIICVKMASN